MQCSSGSALWSRSRTVRFPAGSSQHGALLLPCMRAFRTQRRSLWNDLPCRNWTFRWRSWLSNRLNRSSDWCLVQHRCCRLRCLHRSPLHRRWRHWLWCCTILGSNGIVPLDQPLRRDRCSLWRLVDSLRDDRGLKMHWLIATEESMLFYWHGLSDSCLKRQIAENFGKFSSKVRV